MKSHYVVGDPFASPGLVSSLCLLALGLVFLCFSSSLHRPETKPTLLQLLCCDRHHKSRLSYRRRLYDDNLEYLSRPVRPLVSLSPSRRASRPAWMDGWMAGGRALALPCPSVALYSLIRCLVIPSPALAAFLVFLPHSPPNQAVARKTVTDNLHSISFFFYFLCPLPQIGWTALTSLPSRST